MHKSQHAVEDGGYAFDVISIGNNSNEEAAEIDKQAHGDRFSGLVSPDGAILHPEPPSFENSKNCRGDEADCQGIVTPALPFDRIFKEVDDISQFAYPSPEISVRSIFMGRVRVRSDGRDGCNR